MLKNVEGARLSGMDLNELSPAALKAAMKGGTKEWGLRGSSSEHVRYAQTIPSRSRRRCHCGCGKRATHLGMCNGVGLLTGCQFFVMKWVKVNE